MSDNIEMYQSKDGETQIEVKFEKETVWLNRHQIASLFARDIKTVGKHINNVYQEGELDRISTVAKFATVQDEGGRAVERQIEHYNLDVIISVGYRVKSQKGVQFRQWATQRLTDYLIKGYSVNTQLLKDYKEKAVHLEKEIDNLNQQIYESQKTLTDGLLTIISQYSKSFELLNQYDKDELSSENLSTNVIYTINYQDVRQAIQKLKSDLINKREASELFGNEKDDSFKGILGSVSQTVFGELAYPTVEEQAVQLLYSIIKGHPFSDGNKRIGSFLFVWFLEQNKHHLNKNKERKINDNTLVIIALAVAQSLPEQREAIRKLIMNLIKN